MRSWFAWGLGLVVAIPQVGCGAAGDGAASTDAEEPGYANPSSGAGAASSAGGSANVGTGVGSSSSASGSTSAGTNVPSAPVGANSDAEAPDVDAAPPTTSPFVMTEHDPQSTFGADTDTASYDQFASDIGRGQLPSASTVRLEDFVNYFNYSYPAPAPEEPHPFSISLAAAPSLFWEDTLLLRVGIQGRLPSAKKPTQLVFLIDTSGSMQDPLKLPLVQLTVKRALGVLDPSDRVSIVTYAGDTRVALKPTPISDAGKIEAAVDSLLSGGGTNGGAGLQLAYEQARLGFLEGGINHVILCTDGDFNLGVSSTEGLLDLITEERKSGITLTALGFGSRPNDSMMEKVSNAGNGTYAVIYSDAQSQRYVDERLLANLEYIAKDMKIQVEFNPEKVLAYRLLGYDNRAIADEDFRDDVVDAGEVGAGSRVTALYQVVLVDHEIPKPTSAPAPLSGAPFAGELEVVPEDFALVKVRYKQPEATEADAASEVSARLGEADVAAGWEALDTDFQWAFALASYAEILKQSPYADPRLLKTIGLIVNRDVAKSDVERRDFQHLFAVAEPLITPK